jgi:hypothetical protein
LNRVPEKELKTGGRIGPRREESDQTNPRWGMPYSVNACCCAAHGENWHSFPVLADAVTRQASAGNLPLGADAVGRQLTGGAKFLPCEPLPRPANNRMFCWLTSLVRNNAQDWICKGELHSPEPRPTDRSSSRRTLRRDFSREGLRSSHQGTASTGEGRSTSLGPAIYWWLPNGTAPRAA